MMLWRHGVRRFDADAILYGDTRCKKMDILMFKQCFQCDLNWNQVKICKNTSTFFIFTIVLQIFPGFFSRARSTAGEGGTGKYQPWYQPRISPLLDFWIPGLDSSIWLGWYAWAKSLVSSSLGPVVNILEIFSNANILKKNKRIKIYHIKGIGCPLLISINIVIFDQGTEK